MTLIKLHIYVPVHLLVFFSQYIRSIDRVASVDNHSRSLYEARFAASKEKHAVRHLLRCAHATHGCDTYCWLKDFSIRFRHWRIDNTWADAVDPDEVLGVLYGTGRLVFTSAFRATGGDGNKHR